MLCIFRSRRWRAPILVIALWAALITGLAPPAKAQGRISFIRDAEVESTIRAYATPLFVAAGLDPAAIQVHLVNDRSLNAFVANGLNMFINTGLLIRADNAGQIIGVIAHETGHITGGHLARIRDGMRDAMAESIVAMVLGAAAAIAGSGDAGMAIITGGTQIAERGILRYTRDMESSADQAGVNLLDKTGQSSKGLAEFLDILADQELVAVGRQDPYLRTHPITRDRVEFVRNHAEHSRYSNVPIKPEFAERHRRMRAKLQGYLDPARALQVYKADDPSIEARYARAIAFSRRPDYPQSLALFDALIAERPNDPFFVEAKAQTLYESGKPVDAIPFYEKAVALAPNEPLLHIDLARVQLATEKPAYLKAAIGHLEYARRYEDDSGELWRLLAVAYGRDNQIGMATLAQAERAMLSGRRPEAKALAERAEKMLPVGSPGQLRAQDIRSAMSKPEPPKPASQ
jgi:predicted Zn-dependent protease